MFHFAYYIVHQQTIRESSLAAPQDFLYLFVLEDYLNFFLPPDGSPILPSNLKTKPSLGSVRKPTSWHEPRTQYFQNQFKGLIKPSSGRVSPPTTHHGVLDHGSQEIWRSETFVQVMIEFWLNQNTVGSFSSNVLSHGQEYFMPSLDHVRVVRMLVKQVHSFVYAKTTDLNQLPILHPSDELRRELIPQFLQKKLYHFLCHCFSHWPLDPSFRYVSETWLSYIQPWRYSKHHGTTSSGSDESRETASPLWKAFIFDNLLFYSALLFEFVSRACRFNLSSARDAHLLFRVIKVFAQTHLVDMIEEGENAYLAPSGNRWSAGQSSLTASSSAIKAHITELEGSSYTFKSVFHQPGASKMGELHSQVLSALHEANSNSQAAQESQDHPGGIAGLFKSLFNSGHVQDDEFDRKTEEGKLVSNLKQTCELLSRIVRTADSIDASIFNNTIQWETTSPVSGRRYPSLPGSQASLPDHVETDRGLVPTPLGRYQMMNGLRKFEVRYTGDPELQPICSFENPALVRLFYKLSTHLNKKFGKSLDNMYTNSRLFRNVACMMSPALKSASSPTQSRQPSTSPVHSPQSQLQISLRFLASYKTLIYLFIFWLFCRVTSMNTVLVILLWLIVLVTMVLYHLTPRHKKSLINSR
ncbi:sphingomyelin phosphodiesterase 4-like isoform X2 [Oculina patagonica]